MALYAGLSPQDALALWYQNRQKYGPDGKGATTPEEQADYAGNFATLAKENPAAWMAVKTGQNDNGKTRQIFNPTTGGWDTQQVKGYWSHPESWIQAAAGAGLGLTAAGAFGNAPAFGGGGATSAASSAASAGGSGGTTGGGMGVGSMIKTGLDWYNRAAPAIDAVSGAGQIAGNDAAAAAQGRAAQAQLQQGQDRNALALYEARLRAAQQALNQHSQLASQAGHGDLLANVQDVQFSNLPASVQGHMPTMTGGLRPSVLGPNARQAGQTLSRNALLQLLAGDTNLPQAPTLTPLPNASGYDAFTKGLARAGSYAGALNPLFQYLNQKPYETVGPPLPPGADIFQD